MNALSRFRWSWPALVVACISSAASAADWGNLTGRFVYDGIPPTPRKLVITTDVEYAGKFNLTEERLVVDPASRGVANVVIWLNQPRETAALPIHKSYLDTTNAQIPLDSTKCRIDPHVCLLRTTQTLLLRNTDPIGDGVKIDSFKNPSVNILLPPKGEMSVRFPNPERLPIRVSCPVHPWESGWLFVCDHPYMAVTREDGRFELSHLPCGDWTFQFWHESAGYLQQVTIEGEAQTWRRGRVAVNIAPGANDLGNVTLAAAIFSTSR